VDAKLSALLAVYSLSAAGAGVLALVRTNSMLWPTHRTRAAYLPGGLPGPAVMSPVTKTPGGSVMVKPLPVELTPPGVDDLRSMTETNMTTVKTILPAWVGFLQTMQHRSAAQQHK
jgi:hypothetical protein